MFNILFGGEQAKVHSPLSPSRPPNNTLSKVEEGYCLFEEGYCLFESELALLRERVGRREQTPSHLAAVAASASGLAIIEERLTGGVLLSGDQLTELRQHVMAIEASLQLRHASSWSPDPDPNPDYEP